MEVFSKLWKALGRFAAMLNRLADVGEALADTAERRLGIEVKEPKQVQAVAAVRNGTPALANGNGKKRAAK